MRMIALSAVSFFIGLQVQNLRQLFTSTVGDGFNTNAAWAPDDSGIPIIPSKKSKPKKKKKNLAEKYVEERKVKAVNSQQVNDQNHLATLQMNEQLQLENAMKRAKAAKAMQGHQEQTHVESKSTDNEQEEELQLLQSSNKKKRIKQPRRFEATNYTNDFKPLPWTLPEISPSSPPLQTAEEFMSSYIAAKHKLNIDLPWEEKEEQKSIKFANGVTLPLPIISLNFPKSATLTMKTYFACGGITSIHTSTKDGRIGICMLENQMADRPPLTGCNTHKRHKESQEEVPIDFISDIGLQGPPCYYSSLHNGGLEHIQKYYPHATILLVTRNGESWYKSISKWGSLLSRWKKYCGFDGSLDYTENNMDHWSDLFETTHGKAKYWSTFYHAHTLKIRNFVMNHLKTLTYVEVELNDDMGRLLEQYTGVSAECVMDCHPGPKWVKQNNATSRCHPVGENPVLMMKQLKQKEEEEEEATVNEDGTFEEEQEGENTDDSTNTDDDGSTEEEWTNEWRLGWEWCVSCLVCNVRFNSCNLKHNVKLCQSLCIK